MCRRAAGHASGAGQKRAQRGTHEVHLETSHGRDSRSRCHHRALIMPVRLPNVFAAVRRNWMISATGLIIAVLWGFHAAANSLPGRAYFHVAGLNDVSRPIAFNIVLLPAFLF